MSALHLGVRCDPSTLRPTGAPARLSADALTRHAVCVGMTGSGKTGLCVALLEELALAGVPILALDPKGDLASLALVFPDLAPARFAPWVDPAEAAREGIGVEALAARTAAAWREGLAASGLGEAELAAFRERVAVTVLTPGSDAGLPVDVLAAITRAPAGLAGDPEGLREYVTGAVTALLGLVGLRADPLTDPHAILLVRLLLDAFAAGRDLPLEALLPAVVDPPFDRLGHFPLDDFFPPDDRQALALRLDAVLASPVFEPWRRGVPLDVDALLRPVDGRAPLRVLYLAHLDEPRRMFFVTLLLHAVVAWSRRQPGTAALRALLYFDEVFGYLPPHPRDPPSKWPVLTLMKQARAVGLGVVLCTQNPVDVDHKALSNAGTWLLGRLQTPQDRRRLLDGLTDGGALDADALDEVVGRLPGRTFVLRQVGAAPVVLRSRHVRAFLRGPLTRREVTALRPADAPPPRAPSPPTGAPPPTPPGLHVRWLDPAAAGVGEVRSWRPALYARLDVHFETPGWRARRLVHRLRALDGADAAPRPVALDDAHLLRTAPPGGRYIPLPRWAGDARELAARRDGLRDHAAAGEVVVRWRAPALGLVSAPEEARAAFEARVAAEVARLAPGAGALREVVEERVGTRPRDVEVAGFALVWLPVGG